MNEFRSHGLKEEPRRCAIVGGADILTYERCRSFLRADDYTIFCDSGLRHREGLGVQPGLIVGDFDSYKDPQSTVETITLPRAKDDTDTVFAAKEAIRRGFREFLLLGVVGQRLDHTLVNVYLLELLEGQGCHGMIVDDYSVMELIGPGETEVSEYCSYFSLVNITGTARHVTIRGAKFPLEDAEISCSYQFATSNEVLPGGTARIIIGEGKLLLIRVF